METGFVDGRTAYFDSVSVTLDSFNYSWFPRDDSQQPAADEFFVTVRLEIRNYSAAPRTIDPGTLWVLAVGAGVDPPSVLWSGIEIGRTPRLAGRSLTPGEVLAGWRTFPIPRTALYIDGVEWRPRPGVSLSIPFYGGVARAGVGQVFGRVMDASGRAVPGARVEITKVLSSGLGDQPIGNCVGFAGSASVAETDSNGWYALMQGATHYSKACLDIRVVPPASTGLADAHLTGEMWFSVLSVGEEPPESRIDVILDRAE